LALPYGICGKQIDTTLGQVFLKVIWFSAVSIIHSPDTSLTFIYRRRYLILTFERTIKQLTLTFWSRNFTFKF